MAWQEWSAASASDHHRGPLCAALLTGEVSAAVYTYGMVTNAEGSVVRRTASVGAAVCVFAVGELVVGFTGMAPIVVSRARPHPDGDDLIYMPLVPAQESQWKHVGLVLGFATATPKAIKSARVAAMAPMQAQHSTAGGDRDAVLAALCPTPHGPMPMEEAEND